MVAPMRALLTELQSAIDDAASATEDASDGLRGQDHLALCNLTLRIHEEFGLLEQALPVLHNDDNDNDDGGGDGTVPAARLALHKALSDARIAQLQARIEGLEVRCTKLRQDKRMYFNYYAFYLHKTKLLKARCGMSTKPNDEANRALDAETSAKYQPLYDQYDADQARHALFRQERDRQQQETEAQDLEAIRARWGVVPANRPVNAPSSP
jgi:hypothetical protein